VLQAVMPVSVAPATPTTSMTSGNRKRKILHPVRYARDLVNKRHRKACCETPRATKYVEKKMRKAFAVMRGLFHILQVYGLDA